jgi:hypothetical protein
MRALRPRRRLSPRPLVGFGGRRGLRLRGWALGPPRRTSPVPSRSGSSRGAWGNLSSSMVRRIAAVTAASSASVKSIVGTARIKRPTFVQQGEGRLASRRDAGEANRLAFAARLAPSLHAHTEPPEHANAVATERRRDECFVEPGRADRSAAAPILYHFLSLLSEPFMDLKPGCASSAYPRHLPSKNSTISRPRRFRSPVYWLRSSM